MVQDSETGSVYFSEQQEASDDYYYSSSSYGATIHCVSNPLADNAAVTFFAGSASGSGYSNGSALNSQFKEPAGLAVHWESALVGYLYSADAGNHVIRRIRLEPTSPCTSSGDDVETVAGTPGIKAKLYDDGESPENIYLNNPKAVALDSNGNLYIADSDNDRIRRVDVNTNIVTTVMGHTSLGSDSGSALFQAIDHPHNMIMDSFGNLIVTSSSSIKLIEPDTDGVVKGTGKPHTLYPQNTVSEYNCLDAVALETINSTDDALHMLDSCTGDWLLLQRSDRP